MQGKVARKEAIEQKGLRLSAVKAWLLQHWHLCVLTGLLLLLFTTAAVHFRAHDPYRASQLGQQAILASARYNLPQSIPIPLPSCQVMSDRQWPLSCWLRRRPEKPPGVWPTCIDVIQHPGSSHARLVCVEGLARRVSCLGQKARGCPAAGSPGALPILHAFCTILSF